MRWRRWRRAVVRKRQVHDVASHNDDAVDRIVIQIDAGGLTRCHGGGKADSDRARTAAEVEQGHSGPQVGQQERGMGFGSTPGVIGPTVLGQFVLGSVQIHSNPSGRDAPGQTRDNPRVRRERRTSDTVLTLPSRLVGVPSL